MDGPRFDTLTRSFTTTGSRRRALALALSGAAGIIGLTHAHDAAAGGKCRPKCKECKQCKKGKNGKKGKCKPKPNGTACTAGTCQGGSCIPICLDGIKNGSETDVDCGGTCPRCANGQSCVTRNDCAGAICTGGTCQACFPASSCASGASCICRKPVGGGPGVCAGDPVGPAPSCAECPADTVCTPGVGEGVHCFKRCSAP